LALLVFLAACGGSSSSNDSCFFPSPYLSEVRSKIVSCANGGNIPSKVLLANAIYKDGDRKNAAKLYQEIADIPGGQGLRELSRMENFSGMDASRMLSKASSDGDVESTFIAFNRLELKGDLAGARSILDSASSQKIGRLAQIAWSSEKQPATWQRSWAQKAALAGDALGMHQYAHMLEHGIGGAVDRKEAESWYINAAKKSETPETLIDAARVAAGELGGNPDKDKAIGILMRARSLSSSYDTGFIDKKITSIMGN